MYGLPTKILHQKAAKNSINISLRGHFKIPKIRNYVRESKMCKNCHVPTSNSSLNIAIRQNTEYRSTINVITLLLRHIPLPKKHPHHLKNITNLPPSVYNISNWQMSLNKTTRWTMYVKRNIVARSRIHYCSVNATTDFVFFAHYIKRALFSETRYSSSSSIGTATLVGFGLLNYYWLFSGGTFLQSAVASGTSNPPTWRTSD